MVNKRQRSYLSFILICLSALVPGNHAAAQEANLMLPTDHVFSIDCIGVSPDGKYIATSGSDKVLKIWDAHEKKQLLNLPIGEVNNISFSKDNNYLICSSKGTVLLLDAITGGLIREFPGHNDKINTVRFNPSDDLLITSSADHTSMIWNVKTGQLMHVFDEGQRIYLSSFSEDGRKIITVTERGYTWWDASS
ncbi:MAG: WD40 repeat domain-containing protein [Mucilaginibacter sp.]